MRLCRATQRTVLSIASFYVKAQPYVAYFHWFRSDMSMFLTVSRIVVPAVAGVVMASVGFFLSILGAIAHTFVSSCLGLSPEQQLPRVEPKLLAPTLHSRNASTASLYSLALSHDSDSLALTTTETTSSRPHSKGELALDVPLPSPQSSQTTASGSNSLQSSKETVVRNQSPIRRLTNQIHEDCKKRRSNRKSTSPLQKMVALPPPLTPIPSAEPSTPSLSEQLSLASHESGSDSPRPAVSRSVTSPTSIPSPKKWLPRRQHSTPPQRPAPLQRTDPYQAPYFFPTPLSPDAADYVRQVRVSRSSAAVGGTVFEQKTACESGGPSRARVRGTSIDEQLSGIGENVVGQGGREGGERAKEKEGQPARHGKQKQIPNRRLSWHPVTVQEEPESTVQEERLSPPRSGSDSVPSSPTSFLRKSRSLLRAPEALTSSARKGELGPSGRSRSGPSPSPDTREGSASRPRKKFSLLEKIHHRRSYSGDKNS